VMDALLLSLYGYDTDADSFPTRRSSDLEYRQGELATAIDSLETQKHLDDTQVEDRRRWIGEYRALTHMLRDTWNRNALTGLGELDRKSTRLNSSHVKISYAVFCLKRKTM